MKKPAYPWRAVPLVTSVGSRTDFVDIVSNELGGVPLASQIVLSHVNKGSWLIPWMLGAEARDARIAQLEAEVAQLEAEVTEVRYETATVRRAYLHERDRANSAVETLRHFAPVSANLFTAKAYEGKAEKLAAPPLPTPWTPNAFLNLALTGSAEEKKAARLVMAALNRSKANG